MTSKSDFRPRNDVASAFQLRVGNRSEKDETDAFSVEVSVVSYLILPGNNTLEQGVRQHLYKSDSMTQKKKKRKEKMRSTGCSKSDFQSF